MKNYLLLCGKEDGTVVFEKVLKNCESVPDFAQCGNIAISNGCNHYALYEITTYGNIFTFPSMNGKMEEKP